MCLLTDRDIQHPRCPFFNHWKTCNTLDLPKTGLILNKSSFDFYLKGCFMSQFIRFCCVEGLFLLWSSMWYTHRRYRKLLQSSLLGFGMRGTKTSSVFLPVQLSCPGCSTLTLPLSLLALLWPACVLPLAQAHPCSWDCAAVKIPSWLQVCRWGAPYTTNQLHRSFSPKHMRTRLQLSSQTRAIYSSTVVKLWCFLYHVCQWDISLSIFWLQPLHSKKRGLFVSLVLDCQLGTTLTTFTHTDSELPHIKYKLKWLATSNCCILAGVLPFCSLLAFKMWDSLCSHLAHGM